MIVSQAWDVANLSMFLASVRADLGRDRCHSGALNSAFGREILSHAAADRATEIHLTLQDMMPHILDRRSA
jgi:hypothetical protein